MNTNFVSYFYRKPDATAFIKGSNKYPNLNGRVSFYQTHSGVIVLAEIVGLPKGNQTCRHPIFGFHIHEGNECKGTENMPFSGAKGHYNPNRTPHPCHAGDMPPLFGADGKAFSAFLTDRFKVSEIIGRTVIIHAAPDDFTSQPSGNAGEMMACGVITSH